MKKMTLKQHLLVNIDTKVSNSEARKEYQERNIYYIERLTASLPTHKRLLKPSYCNDYLCVKKKYVKLPVETIKKIEGNTATLWSGLTFDLPATKRGIYTYGEWGGPRYYRRGLVVPKKLLNAAMRK